MAVHKLKKNSLRVKYEGYLLGQWVACKENTMVAWEPSKIDLPSAQGVWLYQAHKYKLRRLSLCSIIAFLRLRDRRYEDTKWSTPRPRMYMNSSVLRHSTIRMQKETPVPLKVIPSIEKRHGVKFTKSISFPWRMHFCTLKIEINSEPSAPRTLKRTHWALKGWPYKDANTNWDESLSRSLSALLSSHQWTVWSSECFVVWVPFLLLILQCRMDQYHYPQC